MGCRTGQEFPLYICTFALVEYKRPITSAPNSLWGDELRFGLRSKRACICFGMCGKQICNSRTSRRAEITCAGRNRSETTVPMGMNGCRNLLMSRNTIFGRGKNFYWGSRQCVRHRPNPVWCAMGGSLVLRIRSWIGKPFQSIPRWRWGGMKPWETRARPVTG